MTLVDPIPDRRTRQQCPSCGSSADWQSWYDKWGYRILRCAQCGLGRTAIAPDFSPEQIYGADYFQGGRTDGYADYAGSEQVLRREFRRVLAELRRHAPATGTLLEIGCAQGFFLLEATPYYQALGVDISPDAVERCQARGLDVRRGRPGEDDYEVPAPLAAVVMLDCIEHLADPAATMRWVADRLQPGGALLITTGDWSSLAARIMGRRWRLMTPPQHLWFFSRSALAGLLGRAGLKVVSVAHPWKLVPLGLAAYQVGNRLGLRCRWLEGWGRIALPVTLGDSLRLVARKE